MYCQNLKKRSRASSSSSGSCKLIHEHELECRLRHAYAPKDLFEELIQESGGYNWAQSECVMETISRMNLSPRSQLQGCKCSKIDCLKMYCQCFSKGRVCNENCECVTCCNKEGCEEEIYRARQMANFRHPGTFPGIPAFVPIRRCTCKKSGCKKNYCECYRAGLKCTQQCECLICQNGKPHKHDFFDSRIEIEVNA